MVVCCGGCGFDSTVEECDLRLFDQINLNVSSRLFELRAGGHVLTEWGMMG